MKIAYGEANKAKWVLDAEGDFRTLVITNSKGKEENLRFRLDDDLYLYCKDGNPYSIDNRMLYNILSEILIFIADTEEVDDVINEIMIALL